VQNRFRTRINTARSLFQNSIDPEKRVRIQGIWQKYIDHSISSTINLPEEINPETISDIYLNAWKYRLKGITIYRAGSRYPILSTEGRKTEFQELKEKEFEIEVSGEKKKLKGGEIITLDNGKLTTVYHAVSGGTISKGIVTV
jgi:ribonucleoside-diphosphate reductase alpha chain